MHVRLPLLAVLALASGVLLASGARAQGALVVYADTLYTMTGPPIVNGAVVVRDGKIVSAGPARGVRVPAGARELRGVVVTPGLVDVRSTVGLSGLLNQPQDQDALDRGSALQPSLRAMDAYNAQDELVEWLLALGVTTVHTGHAPGALAAGTDHHRQDGLPDPRRRARRLDDDDGDDGRPERGRHLRLPGHARPRRGRDPERALRRPGLRPEDGGLHGRRPSRRDLDKEALAAVARGRMPALITAHRATDILTVLRLAREFPEMRVVLSGASEAPLVLDAIRASGVPVVLHPTMYRTGGETESLAFDTAAKLRAAGVPFAIQSGYEAYVPKTRVVLFEAAVAAAYGLDRLHALEAITIDAARILGVDDRVGSLAPGKDADLVLFDGDPLETISHVCAVVVDGIVVREECF